MLWAIILLNCLITFLTRILNTKDDPETFNCDNFKIGDGNAAQAYEMFLAFIILFLFLLLVLCYVRIYVVAVKFVKKRRSDDVENSKQVISTTVTTAIIVCMCGICWLPTTFKYVCRSYCLFTTREFLMLFMFCEIVLYLNSVVNPIIYGYRIQEFRKAYSKVLSRLCRGQNNM